MTVSSGDFRSMRKTLFIAAVIAAVFVVDVSFFRVSLAPAREQAGPVPVRKKPPPPFPEPHPFGDALPAKGKFLVANNTIIDPRFQQTVVLLIHYDATGATGLIINRPTKVPLAEMLANVPTVKKRSDIVYYGGPVEGERMFMLIRSDQGPEESENVFLNVYVSVSRSTLERMMNAHKTKKQFRVYSGYAGWSPGQLDMEVSRGDWYILDADADTIFEKKSSEVWRELIRRSSSIQVWTRQ